MKTGEWNAFKAIVKKEGIFFRGGTTKVESLATLRVSKFYNKQIQLEPATVKHISITCALPRRMKKA